MMKREERAKQFAPFEALTGLRKALAAKEREHERVEKTELSEARAEKINNALKKIERGARIKVTYYSDGYYVDVEGVVTEFRPEFGYLKIGNGKIHFDDLYSIVIAQNN